MQTPILVHSSMTNRMFIATKYRDDPRTGLLATEKVDVTAKFIELSPLVELVILEEDARAAMDALIEAGWPDDEVEDIIITMLIAINTRRGFVKDVAAPSMCNCT